MAGNSEIRAVNGSAVPKTMHGSRALIHVDGELTGIFNSVSYSLNYDTSAVFILGRFNPVEIVITGQEPVTVTCQGWRVIDSGPFKHGVPTLGELLRAGTITLSILDRQTNKIILEVDGCVAHGFSSASAAKSIQEMTINFQGTALHDETDGAENSPGKAQGDSTAADLP